MRRIAVNKRFLAQRVARSRPLYEQAATIQREMAARLIAMLRDVAGTDSFENVLELGCGTGLATRQLLANCRMRRLVLNDLVPEYAQTAQDAQQQSPGLAVEFLPGDMEVITLPEGLDLIVSNAVVQWAEDLPALLHRLAQALRPGGILALATFGPSNLREVSRLTGFALPYRSRVAWRAWLADGWDVLCVKEETRTLKFACACDVLRHLRQTGVNALQSQPWTRARILDFFRKYEATFEKNGRVPLTYHPLFLIAQKRPVGENSR